MSKEYRKKWKKKLCESEDIEIFGENEFFGGKADAFEECLEIIKKALIDSKSSLSTVVMVVNELEGNYNHRRSEDDPKSVFHNKLYIDELMKLAVNKIRDFSNKDKLSEAPHLE